jgi:nucleotide-binding universal stress UspA family protein
VPALAIDFSRFRCYLLLMYRKVLAAVNEYVNSEVAGQYAKQLAKQAGAKLYLCSIAAPGQNGKSIDLAKAAAKRLLHTAHEMGMDAELLFDTGEPVSKIRQIVRAHDIDIVFAATRHEDIQKRFYAGPTIARRLLHQLTCSVALMRIVHMGRISPREILVPLKEQIDFVAERAYFTAMLALVFSARVNLFHVATPVRNFFSGETHLNPVEWEAKIPPDISRFISHLDGYGVEHEKRLAPGVEGKSIMIEAASKRRDLIVMGASVRGFIDFLLQGNPMEYVLRETPCNLIILKPGR